MAGHEVERGPVIFQRFECFNADAEIFCRQRRFALEWFLLTA